MRRLLSSPFFFGVLSLLMSCSGARFYRPRSPIPTTVVTELEALEQTMDEAQHALEATDPAACPERCRSVEAICDASARICEIASELDDPSVSLRCARAERACDEARRGTSPSCGCSLGSQGQSRTLNDASMMDEHSYW